MSRACLEALRAKLLVETEKERAAGGSLASGWPDPGAFFSGDYLHLGWGRIEQASSLSPHTLTP